MFTVNGNDGLRQTPLMAKHPAVSDRPTFDVVVERDEMFNPLTVVVPEVPSISRAEMDDVALPATVVVEK